VIRIAPKLELPAQAVTETFAILGKRGMGKTNTSVVLTEEMIGAGAAVVVLDPVGVWWGLRYAPDQTGAGLPVLVLGGEHGDVPLEPSAGHLVADTLVETRKPMVLDLSTFSKTQQRTFVGDFAEQLYRKNREAIHVVLDEADVFAPQRLGHGDERMFGAVDALVRRGRARGIGVTLISQRPAVINKDVLTQAEVLVAHRLTSPQDRDAVKAWVDVHADDREKARTMIESLPSLPVGVAWVWSPGWLEVWERVSIRARHTFDSSATPKPGAPRVQPGKAAAVDLEALRESMAALLEEKATDDPKALRSKLVELERQLKARPSDVVEVRVEIPVFGSADAELLQRLSDRAHALHCEAQDIKAAVLELAGRMRSTPAPPAPPPRERTPSEVLGLKLAPVARGSLPRGEDRILAVLKAAHPKALTPTQIAVRSVYAHGGGGFRNNLSALRTKGLIEGLAPVAITTAGLKASTGAMARGEALVAAWKAELGKAARLALDELVKEYPKVLSLRTIAQRTGYEVAGGGFRNEISRLRSLKLVDGKNELRASPELFA
jgi:hypothetical protein